jgi:hypothetical protein
MLYYTILYNTISWLFIFCYTKLYYTIRHYIMLYYTELYYTILCYTVLHGGNVPGYLRSSNDLSPKFKLRCIKPSDVKLYAIAKHGAVRRCATPESWRSTSPSTEPKSAEQKGLPRPARFVVPRATPGFLYRATPSLMFRELLPVCCAESYSRFVMPRATPSLLCRELSQCVVPRATSGLLCRELLPVGCAESYSQSVAPRATPNPSLNRRHTPPPAAWCTRRV